MKSKFTIDIGIAPEAIQELADCALLLKWRTGMAMDEKEVERLERVISNFNAENQLLVRMPWGFE